MTTLGVIVLFCLPVLIYILVRLGALAFFRSKRQVEKEMKN